MAVSTSIASQLRAIKSFVKADAEPLKKPFTRPSLLFDSKEAADTDLDTIFSIALSGLESLVSVDERFRAYKNDLFSHKSRGLDRELMNIEENNRINITITSYLRLISGHLKLPAAFKTLEYLIRRYKIHVYNMEELILCALPYHDTHAFVRIVQLIDLGNTKWKFLNGVKVSGAPPPRKVIVQQCLRDFGVMECLCNYSTPTKKDQKSMPVISFCITVVVEVLGSVATVDSDLVKRVLPFVAGIQSGAKGISDYKAGALMIIGVLANRAALSEKLVKSLLRSIAEFAQEAESTDLQWIDMSMMALISLVQLQAVPMLPKKVLDSIIRFRDLSQIISGLAVKFNIEKFLRTFVSSLFNYSESDDLYKTALVSILKDVPMKGIIHHVVSRFLSSCLTLAQTSNSELLQPGTWAKQVLVVINEKYPEEFRNTFQQFMEDAKVQSKGESLVFDSLCRMLDGNSNVEISDSKIWFALEHPKAEIRLAKLRSLDTSKLLDGDAVDYQGFMSIQDAVIRRFYDDDLDVIKAALSLNRLSELIGSIKLLEVLKDVLKRSTNIVVSGTPKESTKAGDICLSCLELSVTNFEHKEDYKEELASMMHPFLLIFPKFKKLNLKVQELFGKIKWPFYRKLTFSEKHSGQDSYLMNAHTISSLAEVFSESPEEYLPWLVKCSDNYDLSKTIFILVLQQSCISLKNDARIFSLFKACFGFLQNEWIALEKCGDLLSGEEIKTVALDVNCIKKCIKKLDQLRHTSHRQLHARIILCAFWNLVASYLSALPTNISWDDNGEWFCNFSELYVFFAERKLKNLFKDHLQYIAQNLKVSPVNFFSMFITSKGFSTGVQVTCLHSLTALCSAESLALQLLHAFPSVLVPLSSEVQDVREAAMDFVEELLNLWSRSQSIGKRNGNNESWSSVDGLLRLLVQQKQLITSDRSFLASLFASVFSPAPQGLLVLGERFDNSTMEDILGFILGFAMKLPDYAKLKILLIFKDAGASMMSVKDVQSLLSELLQRLQGPHFGSNNSCQKLSNIDADILCLLLETCCVSPSPDVHHVQDKLLAALQIDDVSASDPAKLRPCTTVLLNLNDYFFCSLTFETQEFLLHKLVLLHQSPHNDVQNAAKDALLRLNITSSPIIHMLDSINLSEDNLTLIPQQVRKKSKKHHMQKPKNISGHKSSLGFVSSLLDVLLLKKDIKNRTALVKPLFHLLESVFSVVKCPSDDKEEWMSIYSTLCYAQQTILLILEDIARSISCDILSNDCILCDSDIKLLVECASSCKEIMILNQSFSLFSTVTKIMPGLVLQHIPDILTVTCRSTLSQEDSYSKSVFEDLISAVVPCWLSNGKDTCSLLQIFIEAMGDVAQHRRLAVGLHILRTLGEQQSLGSLFGLLMRSMVTRIKPSLPDDRNSMSDFITTVTQTEWEFTFALQICQQYSTTTWLPSLVLLLKFVQSGNKDKQLFTELLYAANFVQERLLDPELLFKLDSEDCSDIVQGTLGELVEQVVCCLVLVDSQRDRSILPAPVKKELKELLHGVLINTTKKMIPSTLFRATNMLMGHAERNVTKKALRLICETVRDNSAVKSNRGKESNVYLNNAWNKLDRSASDALVTLCSEILQMVDQSHDEPDQSLKLAAVSAVEVLASRFPSDHPISNKCLSSMVKNILSDDLSIASSCLKTTGTFIHILGPKALPELPGIMTHILKQSQNLNSPLKTDTGMEKITISLLITLEALVEKLGPFLNPYLTDIFKLLVLNPSCISDSDQKLKAKAEAVRQLISELIPVRLALPPLLKLYPEAVKSGDLSLRVVFEMLTSFVSRMDRASVSSYHREIFNLLLLALDLRRQHHPKIERINVVEDYVINAMVALTMKLTETMFKPLFIGCIEWVESAIEENEQPTEKIDRAIAFYRLVNKLAENHRSLFVPYFKYLLKGSIEFLSEDGRNATCFRKKKKAKLDKTEDQNVESDAAALGKWHLCALVVSSLHKCFLYDTGKQKFLDSTNFQELLKPIVAQMVSIPPPSLEEEAGVPSEKEVDDLLVSCIGQMAVAAGSDLLWKPLNYEVLMQTRSEMLRARILGLKIVKNLIEKLKEEYMVLLAETIPFLVELLEDAELSVKTLAQQTLKELEVMSGEDLRSFF